MIDLSKDTLAQIAHTVTGAVLVLMFAYVGHPFLGVAVTEAVAIVKETIFDPLTETKAFQGSGWRDWAFWNVGIGLALVFLITVTLIGG